MAKNLRLTDTVVIANAGTVSTSLTLENNRIPIALRTPSALTGVTFTFNVSADGTTFSPLYYESTAYSVTVSTSRHIALSRLAFDGCKYLQIVSGSAEGAARTIGVISGE